MSNDVRNIIEWDPAPTSTVPFMHVLNFFIIRYVAMYTQENALGVDCEIWYYRDRNPIEKVFDSVEFGYRERRGINILVPFDSKISWGIHTKDGSTPITDNAVFLNASIVARVDYGSGVF